MGITDQQTYRKSHFSMEKCYLKLTDREKRRAGFYLGWEC